MGADTEQSRLLDPAEHYFWLLDQTACMNFVVFAELDRQFPLARWQRALDILCRETALLRTVLRPAEGGRLRFLVRTTLSIGFDERQETTDTWLKTLATQLEQRFTAFDAALVRALHLPLSDGRTVVALTFHHALADGRSGMNLLKALLDNVVRGDSATPDHRLAAGLHDHFPARFDWPRQPEALHRLANLRRAELKRHGLPDRLQGLHATAPNREARILRIELDQEQTRALRQACQSAACSIHGALGAALLLALHEADGRAQDLTLSLTTPADLRPLLDPADGKNPTELLGLYISMLSANYPVAAGTGFWPLAKTIGDEVRQTLQRGDGHLLYHLYQPCSIPADQPQALADFNATVARAHPSALLSNLGVVEAPSGAGDAGVTAMSFALCPMPSQCAFAAVTTFSGRLLINLIVDLARMPLKMAETLAKSLQDRLLANLAPRDPST